MDKPVTQPESPFELNRRLENLARVGTVVAVRTAKPARCRVRIGDNTTNWLPWMTRRAGGPQGGRTWWPPVVGEQCLVICPGGDLLAGLVIPGIYSDAMDAPSDKAACESTEWAPNNTFSWTDEALTILCGQSITLQVGNSRLVVGADSITMQVGSTQLQIDGNNIRATPDVIGGGHVSLVNHVHSGVIPGPSVTGAPE